MRLVAAALGLVLMGLLSIYLLVQTGAIGGGASTSSDDVSVTASVPDDAPTTSEVAGPELRAGGPP